MCSLTKGSKWLRKPSTENVKLKEKETKGKMKKLYFFEVAAELEDNFFGSGGGNEMVMTEDFI